MKAVAFNQRKEVVFMKIAYRIVTPILAVASIVFGIFLKMFYFTIGSTDESIGSIVNVVSQLSNGSFSTTYEYSVFELAKLLLSIEAPSEDGAKTFTEVAAPIIPYIIAFFVVIIVAVLICVAIAVVSAALKDSKKKRQGVIILSVCGLISLFACIIISNGAFDKIINGDISLTDLISVFSDSALLTLATAILTITSATLSSGFYAMFGMFMLIIFWTILTNMLINTPIQKTKKAYKRKKPMKKLSAVIRK